MATEASLTIRLALSSSRREDDSLSGSAGLQETVIAGRRSASAGEGASKRGYASGTRRHLLERKKSSVELIINKLINTLK